MAGDSMFMRRPSFRTRYHAPWWASCRAAVAAQDCNYTPVRSERGSALPAHGRARHDLSSGEGAAEVLEQVLRILEPDRPPPRTLGNAGYSLLIRTQFPATHHLLRHHQRLGGADTGSERIQLQCVGEAPRRGPAAPEV